ncbi:MAG TPA: c-type cytochrome [Gammaproteobacteria bacterium]
MSDQERHLLIDSFTLVSGILIGTVIGLGFMVRMIFFDVGAQFAVDDPAVEAEIAARIEPIGQVILMGSDDLLAAQPTVVAEPVATVLTGPQVYNQACVACHSPATAAATRAPAIGDGAAWEGRLTQGMETLIDHAINGYTGDNGYMPPKGGQVNLSDDEVVSAIEYMLEQLGEQASSASR